MSVSGVSGPGAPQLGRDDPVDITALIKATTKYGNCPSVSNAIAFVAKLRELKAAAEANPHSSAAGAYNNMMRAISQQLPQGERIRELIEGHSPVSEAGANLHHQLQDLTTADLKNKMLEVLREAFSSK